MAGSCRVALPALCRWTEVEDDSRQPYQWLRGGVQRWNFLPSTPAPAVPSKSAPPAPLQQALDVPSQPASYSPALTACTCCGEPGWRRTQCRHSSPPSTSRDSTPPVTENGNNDTLILFSAESPNSNDPPVVDPITDALAAAIYKVLEQLELKVCMLYFSSS